MCTRKGTEGSNPSLSASHWQVVPEPLLASDQMLDAHVNVSPDPREQTKHVPASKSQSVPSTGEPIGHCGKLPKPAPHAQTPPLIVQAPGVLTGASTPSPSAFAESAAVPASVGVVASPAPPAS